jgi:hypothetical protein
VETLRCDTAQDRSAEWFVPRFGPARFRYAAGLLFLPYTGMVLAFATIGSLLASRVHWDRLAAIAIIYFLGLGVAAHALDALGSRGPKPWGAAFTRRQLWAAAGVSLGVAYAIAGYYMVRQVPRLSVVAALEGFFVFAYNLEWFGGRFHTDGWFAFSWGFLPVIAGYSMQTNGIAPDAVLVGLAAALLSYVEIQASRPYKALRRRPSPLGSEEAERMGRYEAILKALSLGVISLGLGLLIARPFLR